MTTKERPIIFGAESIRAILDGRKTQMRRVVKPQPTMCADDPWGRQHWRWEIPYNLYSSVNERSLVEALIRHSPYPVGSRWWVRETWCMTGAGCVLHKADHKTEQPYWATLKWNAAITMPRWASRITLEVTGLTAERAWEISYVDTVAEGYPDPNHPYNARVWHAALWDTINARRGYPWISNPWVWSTRVRRVQE